MALISPSNSLLFFSSHFVCFTSFPRNEETNRILDVGWMLNVIGLFKHVVDIGRVLFTFSLHLCRIFCFLTAVVVVDTKRKKRINDILYVNDSDGFVRFRRSIPNVKLNLDFISENPMIFLTAYSDDDECSGRTTECWMTIFLFSDSHSVWSFPRTTSR